MKDFDAEIHRIKSKVPKLGAEEEIQKLTELVESHCPVMDTFMRPVAVSGKVFVEKASVEDAIISTVE